MTSPSKLSSIVALALALALSSCGDDGSSADTGTDTGPSSDTGPGGDTGMAGDTGAAGDTSTAPDTSTMAGARVSGNVSRTGTPRADGIGTLVIGIFDRDPVLERDSAIPVGQALIENADMSADTASVGYIIPNVPPRAEPYFIVAFLDDNDNVDLSNPAPDRGDLVTLDGFASPQVSIPTADPVIHDIVLNANLPF